jgi:hypothetical protein
LFPLARSISTIMRFSNSPTAAYRDTDSWCEGF